jgi:hypothetical protein
MPTVVWLQDLPQGGLRVAPFTTLLTLSVLPILVLYPVNNKFQLTYHQCAHCNWISFPGTSGPGYKFFLSTTGDNCSSSIAQPSPSSSVAGSRSGCWQNKSSNSSNPHSPNLQFEEGSIWESKSSNSSNPHSPHVDHESGSDGKAKG